MATGIIFDDQNFENAPHCKLTWVIFLNKIKSYECMNARWCGVMVARNVVDNYLAHDKPVPIPVRFRAPPNRTLKLVQFQCQGLNFLFLFSFLLYFPFSQGPYYIHDELGRRDDTCINAGFVTP